MAENGLLWPAEKHWLNVRFLNGNWFDREFVRLAVGRHFNTLPMGIRFYFYQEDEPGEADIRIKFSDVIKSRIGMDAKSVGQSSKSTMKFDFSAAEHMSQEDRRATLQHMVLHQFAHALGFRHEHQHSLCEGNEVQNPLRRIIEWPQRQIPENSATLPIAVVMMDPSKQGSIMDFCIAKESISNFPFPFPEDGWVIHGTLVPVNIVLSDDDKRFLTTVYPPREDGSFKPVGDNSEGDSSDKKWWKRLIGNRGTVDEMESVVEEEEQ
ncbi:hypothetical protein ACHAPT_001403 [Fusarium lateritium]